MSGPRCMRVSVSVVGLAWALADAIGAFPTEPERTAAAPAALARQLLDMTGVQGGLVVHFGCAGGELTAALRASDAYVVHGLAFDTDSVEKARSHV